MDTPVLLTVFNRPGHTARVLAALRQARPGVLFVSADAPRAGHPQDETQCARVRELVDQIAWDCDLHTRFADENLGLKRAMSTAIDWFFDHVDAGIILEDDCVPAPDFFPFCGDLLRRYRDDERVMQISGCNFLFGRGTPGASYYFSRLNDVWGWATWRRAWRHFDLAMASYPRFRRDGRIRDYLPDEDIAKWLMSYFDEAYAGAESPSGIWSSAWAYAICCQNGLTAVPTVNLVENIGFERDGTHSGADFAAYGRAEHGSLGSLTHPDFVLPNGKADRRRFEVIRATDPRLRKTSRMKRMRRIVSRLLRRSGLGVS